MHRSPSWKVARFTSHCSAPLVARGVELIGPTTMVQPRAGTGGILGAYRTKGGTSRGVQILEMNLSISASAQSRPQHQPRAGASLPEVCWSTLKIWGALTMVSRPAYGTLMMYVKHMVPPGFGLWQATNASMGQIARNPQGFCQTLLE